MSFDPAVAKAPENFTLPTGELTPTGTQSTAVITNRRRVFALLSLGTIAAMTWWLYGILAVDGFGLLDAVMLLAFSASIPWFVVGFWNCLIGYVVWQFSKEPLQAIAPALLKAKESDPLFIRTAILMTLRNEDPARAFKRLHIIKSSLDATGQGDHFDYFILSDSNIPEVIEAERAAHKAWLPEFPSPDRLIYRVRDTNTGFKAGNVRDFCERWGKLYELMLPLDADSLMTGAAVLHLVRRMQANPRMGILQDMISGLPTSSFFARLYQFGMRHGMRPYTRGSTWWGADCGPFWGHNAAIRIAPFTDYCKLPHLPGKPPFGGHILSHDYVEAALMRRAGFEVRVLPEEDGSYEENPPTMIDYDQRDLRWCNGNLQYFRLVGLPALLPTSRMQFALLIQMFMLSPTIVLFTILAALKAPLWPAGVEFPAASAALLYGILLFMYLSPQFFGILEAVLNFPRSYGGILRLLAGLALNVLFIFFLIPISIFNQAVFMIFLLFGKGGGWATQQRDGYRVPWTMAAQRLWQPTAFAAAILLFLAFTAPGAIPWFLPFLGGLLLSIPFTVLTSMPEVGEAAVRWRLCSVPEEFQTPAEISKLLAPG